MNTPKIKSIIPSKNLLLLVTFQNSVVKEYDCSQLLSRSAFVPLRDEKIFNSVRVDAGGYGVSWNDELDLSEYELWTNGREVDQQSNFNHAKVAI